MPQNVGRRMKRGLDLVGASLGLVAASPLFLLAGVGVWATLGRPIFFRQWRPGRDGVPFQILKFRTMSEARTADGRVATDEERLTRFGTFLRSTSLDELPELWNVLKGDMSLVGPRPLLMEYLDRYTPEQMRRHEVKPGLTGWAQVRGRNRLSWEERFELDVWYVDNWSLLLDMRILLATPVKVLAREGVAAQGHVTMPPFRGQSPERSDDGRF